MITHVCMFKIKEENHDAVLKEALKLAEPLKQLTEAIQGEVVVNDTKADDSNYDICLLFDFENYDKLDAYQKHPTHVKFKEYIVAHMSNRACIDYKH